MENRLLPLATFAVLSVICSSSTWAYDAYKKPLVDRYDLKTVSCKACHADSRDRTIYNKFGQLFVDAMKGDNIVENYEQAKAEGEEKKKEYEAEMAKMFTSALIAVEKKTLTIKDLIQAGLLNGTRPNAKKP